MLIIKHIDIGHSSHPRRASRHNQDDALLNSAMINENVVIAHSPAGCPSMIDAVYRSIKEDKQMVNWCYLSDDRSIQIYKSELFQYAN